MGVEKTSYTVYNIPAEASESYAATRRVFEEQIKLGMHTIDGSLEARFSHHVRVCKVDLILPLLDQLFGTYIKILVARFPKLTGWNDQRQFYGGGSPNLGVDEEVRGAKEKIRGLMSLWGTEEALGEGGKLIAALEIALEDRVLRRSVSATISGLAAA